MTSFDINGVIDKLQKLPDLIYKQGVLVIEANAKYRRAKTELEQAEAMTYNKATGSVKERDAWVVLDANVISHQATLAESEIELEKAKLRQQYRENEFIAARKIAGLSERI